MTQTIDDPTPAQDSANPDVRAAALVEQLTFDEKISLVTGLVGWPIGPDGDWVRDPGHPMLDPAPPRGAVGGDGFVPGVPRLGIPPLQACGAGAGLTNMGWQRPGGDGIVFPSPLAQAATWDPEMTYAFGAALATEAAGQGINLLLAGATNLAVEPRCGRNFEYHGEDPILAGVLVGAELRGTQDQGVIASIKHFAANFQETGRFFVDTVISERALRESDLLVFEIAIAESGVGAVMAAYNKVNGTYACENGYLLNDVLKREWGFPGWVMSDWGATHSTVESVMAGLDQEFPAMYYFGPALAEAVRAGHVPTSRLNDMVHRILRTMIAVGVVDHPVEPGPTDREAIAATSQTVAERSMVLLHNDGLLPLSPDDELSIAVIGGHADIAVLQGGGSAAVEPVGGDPAWTSEDPPPFANQAWVPSSPVAALRQRNPAGSVTFCAGSGLAEAVIAASGADVAIVVATQWATESQDLPDLALPDGQDELIAAVAAANPRTLVVLQTGGAVLMPWVDRVAAVLEAWYPGQRGGEAIANILFGEVNPSGRLPVTFPRNQQDLAHPVIEPIPVKPGYDRSVANVTAPNDDFSWLRGEYRVHYDEGLAIGYKWFDSQDIEPAYCFGYGLSYTTFEYDDLTVTSGPEGATVRYMVTNTGQRLGAEVSQVYAGMPPELGEPPRRLVGWARTELAPGESAVIELQVPPKYLATWDVVAKAWVVTDGAYDVHVGASSRDLRMHVMALLQDVVVR